MQLFNMPPLRIPRQSFNIVAVAQAGRPQYEAVLLAASHRASNPSYSSKLFLAQPQPGPLWPKDPRATDPTTRDLLEGLEATCLPFDNRQFGHAYMGALRAGFRGQSGPVAAA